MALNNLGMGLVFSVTDMASSGLAKISGGIMTVTEAAKKSAAAVPQALGTISRLTGSMFKNVPTAVEGLQSTLATAKTHFAGFGQGLSNMAGMVTKPIQALFNLKTAVVGAVTAMGGLRVINAAAFEESAKMSLGVMLKNKEAAEAAFNKAKHFADTSPFETRETIDALTSLVSSRFSLTDIYQGGLLKDIGNLAAGNPGKTINEVADVFGRLKAGQFGEAFEHLRSMKIGFTDLQQIGGLNIKAGQDFTKLDPKKVIESVRKVIQFNFGGMMDEMQHSWQGVWSTFTSNVDNVFAAIGKAKIGGVSVLDMVKSRVEDLTSKIVDDQGNLTPLALQFIDTMAAGFGKAVQVFDKVLEIVGWLVDHIPKMVDGIKDFAGWLTGSSVSAELLKGSLLLLGTFVGVIYTMAAAVNLAAWATGAWAIAAQFLNLLFVASPIGWIALAIAGLVVLIYFMVKYWDQWTAAVGNALQAILDWWNGLGPIAQLALLIFAPFIAIPLLIASHWTQLKETFMAIWEEIKGAWNLFVAWWEGKISTWDLFGGLFDRIWSAGAKLANMLADGIRNGWNNVVASVSGGIRRVFDYMGFSSPTKLGPGRTADRWGPNLMRMFAGGITAAIPHVEAAAAGVAEALAFGPEEMGLTPPLAPRGGARGGMPTGDAENAFTAPSGPSQGGGGGGLGPIIVKLVVDGRELAETIVPILNDHKRVHFVRG